MPNIQGAKLYLASFTLAIWMAYFQIDTAPISGDILAAVKWALPIAGTAPLPFLGIELTEMLRDFARRLSGKDTGATSDSRDEA